MADTQLSHLTYWFFTPATCFRGQPRVIVLGLMVSGSHHDPQRFNEANYL